MTIQPPPGSDDPNFDRAMIVAAVLLILLLIACGIYPDPIWK